MLRECWWILLIALYTYHSNLHFTSTLNDLLFPNGYQNLALYKLESRLPGKNVNNLRYADDTTLREESEELKSLLMKVKEESEKVGLKLNSQKIMTSGPITSW